MRGNETKTDAIFVYLSPQSFVPKEHPLRPIRTMVRTVYLLATGSLDKGKQLTIN